MEFTRKKFLIIGLGSIGKKHLKAIEASFDAPDVIFLRTSTNLSPEDASLLLNYRVVDNLDDIMSTKFDLIIISNPTYLHYQTLKTVIKLASPILLEKPISHSCKELDSFYNLVKRNNIPIKVGFNLRHLCSLVFFKGFYEQLSESINEVNVYCGSYLPDWRPSSNFRNSYSVNPRMGGGVHFDLIHEIDYCIWIFGFPNKVRKIYSNKSSLRIEAVDAAYYNLEYDNFNLNISLNYFRKDPKRVLEVVTSERSLEVDLLKNRLVDLCTSEILYASNRGIIDTYSAQIRKCVNDVSSLESDLATFREMIDIQKLIC